MNATLARLRAHASVVGMLSLAACNACDKSIVVKPAPAVVWDGGSDDSTHACAVMAAAGCPVGNDPGCASALRSDQQAGDPPGTASQVDLACIIDAGPNPTALGACRVTCR